MAEGHCGQEQPRWVTTVIMSSALQDHEISTILQTQQHRVRYSESVETGSVIFPLSGVAFILSDTQDLLRTGEEEFSERIQKFINIHRNSFLVLSAALHGPEEWSVMFRIQRSLKTYVFQHIPAATSDQIVLHACSQNYSLLVFGFAAVGEGLFFIINQKIIGLFSNNMKTFCKVVYSMGEEGGKHCIITAYTRFLGSNLRVIPAHNPAETVKLMLSMAKITSKPQADDTRYNMEMTKAQIIEKSPVWKMLQEYQLQHN